MVARRDRPAREVNSNDRYQNKRHCWASQQWHLAEDSTVAWYESAGTFDEHATDLLPSKSCLWEHDSVLRALLGLLEK